MSAKFAYVLGLRNGHFNVVSLCGSNREVASEYEIRIANACVACSVYMVVHCSIVCLCICALISINIMQQHKQWETIAADQLLLYYKSFSYYRFCYSFFCSSFKSFFSCWCHCHCFNTGLIVLSLFLPLLCFKKLLFSIFAFPCCLVYAVHNFTPHAVALVFHSLFVVK